MTPGQVQAVIAAAKRRALLEAAVQIPHPRSSPMAPTESRKQMTTHTHPVGATTHHTEQTLKARHQEAIDVYEAWAERVRNSGGQDRVAAVLQMGEAWEWVERTKEDLDLYRSVVCPRGAVVGRTRPHGRVGVIGHPGS